MVLLIKEEAAVDTETMSKEVNYADTWMYQKQVYGVASTATTQGIVYNKKVFEEACGVEIQY